MISDMLWLAKSDNGLLTLQKQPLELKQEVAAIFNFFEAWAAESQVGPGQDHEHLAHTLA